MVTLCRWTGRHRETLRRTVEGRLIGYECAACGTLLPVDVSDAEKAARLRETAGALEAKRQADRLYRRWQRQQTVLPWKRGQA